MGREDSKGEYRNLSVPGIQNTQTRHSALMSFIHHTGIVWYQLPGVLPGPGAWAERTRISFTVLGSDSLVSELQL